MDRKGGGGVLGSQWRRKHLSFAPGAVPPSPLPPASANSLFCLPFSFPSPFPFIWPFSSVSLFGWRSEPLAGRMMRWNRCVSGGGGVWDQENGILSFTSDFWQLFLDLLVFYLYPVLKFVMHYYQKINKQHNSN